MLVVWGRKGVALRYETFIDFWRCEDDVCDDGGRLRLGLRDLDRWRREMRLGECWKGGTDRFLGGFYTSCLCSTWYLRYD